MNEVSAIRRMWENHRRVNQWETPLQIRYEGKSVLVFGDSLVIGRSPLFAPSFSSFHRSWKPKGRHTLFYSLETPPSVELLAFVTRFCKTWDVKIALIRFVISTKLFNNFAVNFRVASTWRVSNLYRHFGRDWFENYCKNAMKLDDYENGSYTLSMFRQGKYTVVTSHVGNVYM